jgi:hypothetical protein
MRHKEVDVDALVDDIMACMRRLKDLFPYGTLEEQKAFLKLFVDGIELDPDARVGKVHMRRLPVPKYAAEESVLVCVAGAGFLNQRPLSYECAVG